MTEVYCAIDHVLLIQDYNDPEEHRHLAKHFIVSLDGEITCLINGEAIVCQGICIDSDVLHTVESNHHKVLVYLLEETTEIASQMKQKYLMNSDYSILNDEVVKQVIGQMKFFEKEQKDLPLNEAYNHFYLSVMKVLGVIGKAIMKYDDRIMKVISILRAMEGIEDNCIEQLARKVYLSPSRLSHLFKQETGIALSSFLVIIKIEKTYLGMMQGENITESAITAGFDSSAHFAATNKRMFGINARSLHLETRLIQL